MKVKRTGHFKGSLQSNRAHGNTRPPTMRCRRKLQGSLRAVRDMEEPVHNVQGRKNKDNQHFTYPRCSKCTHKSPARLRKFAVSMCNVCNVYLCAECTKKHSGGKMDCDGHSMTLLSPKLDADKQVFTKNGHRPLECHEGHKDIPKYFCETCQDIVCLECIQTRHKKHEYVYAKDACGKHKMAFEKHIQNARKEADHIVQQLEREERMTGKLNSDRDKIAEQIKAQTEMVVKVLRKREKQLLQDLKEIYSRKEDVFTKNKERLQNRLELIKRTCHFTENATNDGGELQTLIFEKHVIKRLQELSRPDIPTPVSEGHCLYYVTESSASEAETLLGKVIWSDADPSKCEADGEGLRRTVVGEVSSFVVTVKNKYGKPLTTGGDDVHARITNTRNETLGNSVIDNENGTYTVSYTPNASGVLNISVHLYGQPIKTPNSPDCKFNVICQRDYEQIEKPFMIISHAALFGKECSLKLPCGVTVDLENKGRILVADCHNHKIKLFSRDGKFIKSFGCFGTRNGQLNNPTDIAVSDGKIYVCDKDNNRVQCFTSEGVFLSKFSHGSTPLKRPWGICIDSKGRIVVADTKNNLIQVYSCDGCFLTSFGKEGTGEGEFQQPYYVTSHSNGHIYITDNGNHRVQVFDESYSYLYHFGGVDGALRLNYPTGVTTDHQGHVIVADQCNSRLQMYRANGKHEAVISKPLHMSASRSYPKGLAMSLDGHIIVADSDNDRVLLI